MYKGTKIVLSRINTNYTLNVYIYDNVSQNHLICQHKGRYVNYISFSS